MGRIRSIKPEFWRSESIAALPIDVRLTFIGLWNYVDDNGIGRDMERLIAAELYPLEEDTRESLARIHRALASLATASRITRYRVAGKGYLAITNWDEHQRIDRPSKPRYPQPEEADSPPLTCDDHEESQCAVTFPSHPREDSSRARRGLVAGAGSREQGAGSEGAGKNTRSAEFEKWWALYPKKIAKEAARRAYTRVAPRLSALVLLEGVQRYRDDPNRDPAYTANPATWLNEGRWDDEPLPSRNGAAKPSTGDQRLATGLQLVDHFAQRELM